MMKQYDFRFDTALIKSFIGKTLTKYKHAEDVYKRQTWKCI